MWNDLLLRFFLGGIVVSVFALLGDLFKPKSFAGLFAAAPSVALGSLSLAYINHGDLYASIEGRSMVAGAVALLVYSQTVSWVMMRYQLSSCWTSSLAVCLWFTTAFGIWFFALK